MRALAARIEDAIKLCVIVAARARLQRAQELNRHVRQLRLQRRITFAREVRFNFGGLLVGQQLIDRQQICDRGARLVETYLRA